jgi:hypothetical protein
MRRVLLWEMNNVPHLFVKPGILEFVVPRLTSSLKCSDSPKPALVSIHSSKAANMQNSSTLDSSPDATFHFQRHVLGPGCGYFLYLHQGVRCCGWRLNRLRGEAYLNIIQRSPKLQPEKLYKILNMKQPVITVCSWTARCKLTCFGISCSQHFEQNVVVCCVPAYSCSVSTPDRIQPVGPRNTFRISIWRCYTINRIHQIWHPAIFTPFRP